MSITGIKEIDAEILRYLPDRDLVKMCKLNTYFRGICSNDHFWKLRFQNKYGEDQKKPGDKTWKQFYIERIIPIIEVPFRKLDNIIKNPIYNPIVSIGNVLELTKDQYKKEFGHDPTPIMIIAPKLKKFKYALFGSSFDKKIRLRKFALNQCALNQGGDNLIVINDLAWHLSNLSLDTNNLLYALVDYMKLNGGPEKYTINIRVHISAREIYRIIIPIENGNLQSANPTTDPKLGILHFKYNKQQVNQKM